MQEHENLLVFKPEIARKKPENIIHKDTSCPFCDVASLTNILEQSGDIIWLMNKYQMLEDTWQTVIIESAKHDGDFSNYTENENREIIQFAVKAWQQVLATHKYESVVLYKNYGPLSGGSLSHPHMQIVGFKHMDVYEEVSTANIEAGLTIWSADGAKLNVSEKPIMGPIELNVTLERPEAIPVFADLIQKSVQYVLEDCFDGRCDSYNLFFYFNQAQQIVAKIMPRFIVSPYFVGYKLSGISDDNEFVTIKKDILARLQK
ncbi:DUF4931 domain-containing protein [Agrilactobacillus yilanensis]|uniref:DUF4931 domain-containing protein n=1 Tax=Agrilactobacillus yilanensis TaxID=2485997 RepID=A0ABW4J613_9LACO|nr:DUF4931 domain-containing protein [Agrilactobacillus yilanensis]